MRIPYLNRKTRLNMKLFDCIMLLLLIGAIVIFAYLIKSGTLSDEKESEYEGNIIEAIFVIFLYLWVVKKQYRYMSSFIVDNEVIIHKSFLLDYYNHILEFVITH